MQRKKKILAVDDNPDNNQIVEEILTDRYKLKTAITGEQALDIAVDFQPDLILLDIMMPGMDGYELCRQLRANPVLRNTKIILVSAKSMTSERLAGYEAGADDYVTKPFEGDELLAKIRVYLRLRFIEEMETMRQCFTMTVTHEMRTPMTIAKNILSNATENVYGAIKPELRQQLEIADQNMNRLGRIITNFFEISKIDAGKLDLEMSEFDCQDWVLEGVTRLQPSASARGIQLTAELPTEKQIINADRQKLSMVLTHLVENAIKFIPEGGRITVRVNSGKGHIGIDVEDDGPGIAPQNIETIFDRFVQLEQQVGPGEHGTGLGLAVARGSIEAHDGRIWVRNRHQGGAVFSFEIPTGVQTDTQEEPALIGTGSDAER